MLKRSSGLNPMNEKRRAELAEAGVKHPVSTFKPKPGKAAKAKRWTDTGPDKNTVEVVLERDNFSCTVCGEGLRGPRGVAWSIHHRVRRSQGLDNRPSNLIAVCGGARVDGCHQNIHGAPAKARDAGWLLRGTSEPTQTVMAHSQYGWVLLADDGSVSHRAESVCTAGHSKRRRADRER